MLDYLYMIVFHLCEFFDEVATHMLLHFEDTVDLALAPAFLNYCLEWLDSKAIHDWADVVSRLVYFFVIKVERRELLMQPSGLVFGCD